MSINSSTSLILLILVLILGTAVITDLTQRRVYNWLTLPGLALGIALNAWLHGWSGLGSACLGLLAGGLIFSPAFYFGGLGAGDLKLMAVIGAFLGWVFVINAAVYTALLGGMAAVVLLLVQGRLVKTFVHLGRVFASLFKPRGRTESLSQADPLPYAVFIAAGALAAYFLPPFLVLP